MIQIISICDPLIIFIFNFVSFNLFCFEVVVFLTLNLSWDHEVLAYFKRDVVFLYGNNKLVFRFWTD